jgi:predicted alpha/beta-fold hydrolase
MVLQNQSPHTAVVREFRQVDGVDRPGHAIGIAVRVNVHDTIQRLPSKGAGGHHREQEFQHLLMVKQSVCARYNNVLPPYRPLISNPHVLTVLGNFWPRELDMRPYPVESRLFRTEPDVQVLVHTQRPADAKSRGEIILVHGLEGSSDAGYMRTMAKTALDAGYVVHRFNIRTCGGTERLCNTLYHAGLTGDLRSVLGQLLDEGCAPVHLVGYSLGGNQVLKLAGELGEDARPLIASVCAISTPIDLAAGARKLGRFSNRVYERRFLKRMRNRVIATGRFTASQIRGAGSIYEFDDRITAPSFGFRGAGHYYETQSSQLFLDRIRVPALLIQSKDDIFIPFEIFNHPAFQSNPCLRLLVTDHGGHLGFLSGTRPRFWADQAVMEWIESVPAPREMAMR